ncbi:MAG: cell division protein SepF, partial [Microbacteriaceae bacterium]|nr:cell division protein SepF [Microbacteriaceae bacterium]
MANPLRKTMVYLGLADEEFDYEDAAPTAPAAPVERHTERRAERPVATTRAQVTPLRRAPAPR